MMTDVYGMGGTQDFCLAGGRGVDGFVSELREFLWTGPCITVAFPSLSEVSTAYSHHIPTITSHRITLLPVYYLQCTLEGYENLLTVLYSTFSSFTAALMTALTPTDINKMRSSRTTSLVHNWDRNRDEMRPTKGSLIQYWFLQRSNHFFGCLIRSWQTMCQTI